MASVNLTIECITGALNIRKGPSTSYAKTGATLTKGQKVAVNQKDDSTGWYKLSDGRGWVSGGSAYVKVTTTQTANKTPNPTITDKTPTINDVEKINSSGTSTGFDSEVIKMLKASATLTDDSIDASTRLFGGPHQFTDKVDFRLTGSGDLALGRKYMDNMVTEAPIVYFMPGRPNYLPDMSDLQKNAFKDMLTSTDGNKSIIDSIINNGDFRYYDFIADYTRYIRNVNLLCRSAAIYMGIGDKTAPATNVKYRSFNWANYRYESLYKPDSAGNDSGTSVFNLKEYALDVWKGLYSGYQYTQFYVDPSLSFNETTSNNTSQSKLEGAFDTAEGAVKELAFLLNAGAIDEGQARANFVSDLDKLKGGLGNSDGFFSRLLGSASNVISGANMIFPQIWGDATYNKSYNITINLVSPYGDKESIYLNCIVPMLHLVALAAPQQWSANSYASPPLVRVFAKGWFSCEMGMVDNLTIEKGGQGAWSIDGLPTEIRVSLSVRDMYSHLMTSEQNKPGLFFQNFGLIDFLAVTCGLDITRPNFATQLELLQWTLGERFLGIPENLAMKLKEKIRNATEFLYRLQ